MVVCGCLRLFAAVCGCLRLPVVVRSFGGCLRLLVVVHGVLYVLGMVCRRCCFRLLIVVLVADRYFWWSFAIH